MVEAGNGQRCVILVRTTELNVLLTCLYGERLDTVLQCSITCAVFVQPAHVARLTLCFPKGPPEYNQLIGAHVPAQAGSAA